MEPSQGELVFWQSIKESKDPADFASYLKQFPEGYFRDLAHNRLSALSPPPGATSLLAADGQSPLTPPVDIRGEAIVEKRSQSRGFLRLNIAYWLVAIIVIAVVTIQAGGDEEGSGWQRLTAPEIVYWADDRGMPDILTNEFWFPASLSIEEVRAKLIAEGRLKPTESLIPMLIHTWHDYDAWPVMWWSITIAVGLWMAAALLVWIAAGFRRQ